MRLILVRFSYCVVRRLSHSTARWLFSGGTFIQPLFREDGRDIIHMETVAQARLGVRDDCNAAVAVVIPRDRAVQDTKARDGCSRWFSVSPIDFLEAHDFVTVLCFSAVSVVHFVLSFVAA